ncbi:NAD(P)H-dependent oxidoreductase [Saprospira sp. CCB-QB6]|uniref:NAD(P)H-dependent oxidoreductase n=1 Tax=Saprospira sp. CCB-QB6 TaxID=3023936 RepID=UPI00234B4EE6|nr:NAD(P)H-dependent oxidoreductase [Saprospira sp. CCB-QB6]WCL80923.1 NAD(P)H-dependent oxidoreductase [Saprospira sp. CCB-QB6]
MSLVENLKWRYATKKFDASKKITAEVLEQLKTAIQLSASSYGLQLYKVLDVQNPEVRKKLQAAAWGQSQIVDASQLFVFTIPTSFTAEHIDELIQLTADTRGLDPAVLNDYSEFMKGALLNQTEEGAKSWMGKQAYIALGTLLAAAADLKVDACPMEGFDAAQFDEILGLDGWTTAVIATLGYRHEEDGMQHAAKVRKAKEVLFENI